MPYLLFFLFPPLHSTSCIVFSFLFPRLTYPCSSSSSTSLSPFFFLIVKFSSSGTVSSFSSHLFLYLLFFCSGLLFLLLSLLLLLLLLSVLLSLVLLVSLSQQRCVTNSFSSLRCDFHLLLLPLSLLLPPLFLSLLSNLPRLNISTKTCNSLTLLNQLFRVRTRLMFAPRCSNRLHWFSRLTGFLSYWLSDSLVLKCAGSQNLQEPSTKRTRT